VSNELVGDRAQVLEENMVRWGDARCIVTCAHPKDFAALRHTFDVIVVDAPCSGEGMFRKDPDTIAHWSPGAVRHCSQRQTDILRFVSGALKPGGRLIYSTCTYNEQENESILDWLLAMDRDMYRVLPLDLPEAWGFAPGIAEGHDPQVVHARHAYPHRVKGEGLFFAVLEKLREGNDNFSHGSRDQKMKRKKESGRSKGRDDHDERERRGPRPNALSGKEAQAAAATFCKVPAGTHIAVEGEEVFLQLPQVRQTLEAIGSSVKVIRAGVLAGKVAGQKFIPDHDLALSGWTAERFPLLAVDRENALRYLKRTEPEVAVPEGSDWVIITYEGNPLGWCKAVDGRLNNHLPKHWRIRADVLDEFEPK
jgi:NOL1/NOP2/fmu family ribosome biogenesis protein